MKNTLINLKEAYIKFLKRKSKNDCVGLCFVSMMYQNSGESLKFQQYLDDYLKLTKQKIFYDNKNNEVYEKNQFVWKSNDFESRLKWLDEQIEKLS